MVAMQVGDWEQALAKFKASQASESLALANKEASIENRAMSLAEGTYFILFCLFMGAFGSTTILVRAVG